MNAKTFFVKIITVLEIGRINMLVTAVNGEFAFGQGQLVGQSEQLHVFLESGLDVNKCGNH